MILREWSYTWTFKSGDTSEVKETLAGIIGTAGEIQTIVVVVGDNAASAKADIIIYDAADNNIYEKDDLAHDATTILTAVTEAGNASPEVKFEDGGALSITPEKDPAGDWTVEVYVYYVTEATILIGKLPTLAVDRNGVQIQGALCPLATQRMAFTDTSVQSLPFDGNVKIVRLIATQDCHIAFIGQGDENAEATVYDMLFLKNQPEYFSIKPGIVGIAALRDSANGFLYIASMA